MKNIRFVFAAVLGMMLAACSNDDIVQNSATNGAGGGKPMPFSATITTPAGTRGLTEATDGKSITAKWVVGEEIALIHGKTVDVMKVKSVDDKGVATIDGTITNATEGEAVHVVYVGTNGMENFQKKLNTALEEKAADDPITKTYIDKAVGIMYAGDPQSGTLAAINEGLDYRYASSTLTCPGSVYTFGSAVTPESQLAVVKFSLTDGTSALAAESFEIADNSGQTITTVTPSSATSEFYVAMMPATTQTFRFTAKKDNEEYCYSKYGVTLVAGTYYQSSLTMLDILHTPLTLEATEDGTTITAVCGREIAFQYAINGGTKIDVYSESGGESFNIKLDKAGEFVEFYSKRYDVGDYRLHILPDKETYIYGNVMSLIDDSGQGFANDKAVGENALSSLFLNAEKLAFHPKKRIVLPATTLNSYCYKNMFSGCTGLTELPADLLPATTLAPSCYRGMFKGCTGLTSLPEKLLPATTLVTDCYDSMFSGCKGLETLPADLLPATTLAMDCYKEMFHGCTGLTVAPDLPAPKLHEGCYSAMFYGCTKLSSVKCLATTNVFGSAFGTWLNGAGTAEGCERKLYVDPSMIDNENWQLGTSGEDGKRWTTAVFAY